MESDENINEKLTAPRNRTNRGKRDSEFGRQTAKSIRVSDCYPRDVDTPRVESGSDFEKGGYSAKREVSIGRFGPVCWFFDRDRADSRTER